MRGGKEEKKAGGRQKKHETIKRRTERRGDGRKPAVFVKECCRCVPGGTSAGLKIEGGNDLQRVESRGLAESIDRSAEEETKKGPTKLRCALQEILTG